jgi:hypothetical protein
MLYARELFEKIRCEGSLSSTRAIAQLRQFYLRAVDPTDSKTFQKDWEDKRNLYVKATIQEANPKDQQQRNRRLNLQDPRLDSESNRLDCSFYELADGAD